MTISEEQRGRSEGAFPACQLTHLKAQPNRPHFKQLHISGTQIDMLSSPIQGLGPFFRGSCSVEGLVDQSPFDVYLLYLWIPSNSLFQKAEMQHAERGPMEVQAVRRLLAPTNNSCLPELACKAHVLILGRPLGQAHCSLPERCNC